MSSDDAKPDPHERTGQRDSYVTQRTLGRTAQTVSADSMPRP